MGSAPRELPRAAAPFSGLSLSLPLPPQLQQQQTRLMKINHDLRHRITVVEAQGKSLIEQKVELEAELQTREQEMGSLRAELGKLRERLPRGHSENGEEEPEVSGKPPPRDREGEAGPGAASFSPSHLRKETGGRRTAVRAETSWARSPVCSAFQPGVFSSRRSFVRSLVQIIVVCDIGVGG